MSPYIHLYLLITAVDSQIYLSTKLQFSLKPRKLDSTNLYKFIVCDCVSSSVINNIKNKKISHCLDNSKIQYINRRNRGKINTSITQIHDHSLIHLSHNYMNTPITQLYEYTYHTNTQIHLSHKYMTTHFHQYTYHTNTCNHSFPWLGICTSIKEAGFHWLNLDLFVK